jgi:hypothetical protein
MPYVAEKSGKRQPPFPRVVETPFVEIDAGTDQIIFNIEGPSVSAALSIGERFR